MTTVLDFLRNFLPAFRSQRSERPDQRTYEIDGLRGWASFSVVVYHMTWELFGVLVPSLRNPLTGFFLNGPLAVSVFFVLSGDALSAAYFNGKGDLSVVKLLVKRYSRLAIPVASICLVVFLLCRFGLTQNAAAGKLVERPEWLGSWLRFPMTVAYFLKYSFVSVFIVETPNTAIDPFLWTMRMELIGSMLTFMVLLFLPYFRKPWAILLVLAALALLVPHAGQFSCFLFGIVFSAARSNGSFFRLRANKIVNLASWIGIAIAALCVGFLHWKGGNEEAPAFAVAITFLIFCNRNLSTFFQNKLSLLLGKLSFPMYLTQFPVLVWLTSGLLVFAAERGKLHLGVEMAIAGISVAATVVTAILFDPVEIGTRWFGNFLVNLVMAPAPPAAASIEALNRDSPPSPHSTAEGPLLA